jgi:predicted DNA-binding transcriptional regulator AlpA
MKIEVQPTSPGNRHAAAPALVPLLVPAAKAAALCSMSRATWDRHAAAGLVPAPVRIGPGKGRPLWSVRELEAWTDAGCPNRAEWEARREAEARRRR